MPQFHQNKSFQRLLIRVVVLLNINILVFVSAVTTDQNVDPGDPVYLTPLIEQGELSKATEVAWVQEFYPVVAYSGFITVNSTYNSNIFFCFFPAEGKQIVGNDAPVVLWNDGGPGISGFFSIFGQNGPYTGDNGGNYSMNEHSWHKKYNMIYMDNPVDVGFSFTENESGYIYSAEEAAKDIYEFLIQFFSMFPHLRRNPFYNAGVSYASSAIQTANYIHQRNLGTPKLFINLTGMILDSPWIDSYTQVDYGEYLFSVGLISERSRDHFREKENEIRDLVDQERYLDAVYVSEILKQITESDAFTLTGYGAIKNVYNDQSLPVDMTNFIIQNSTRKALHVGPLTFKWVSQTQQGRMNANILRSAKPQMDTLLQAGYRVLLYVGNMDGLTGHLGLQKLIQSLSWDGAPDLINSERLIWKENGRVAGYNITSSNMTFLIVRNAGHMCLLDQPEWVFSAVKNFVEYETNDNDIGFCPM